MISHLRDRWYGWRNYSTYRVLTLALVVVAMACAVTLGFTLAAMHQALSPARHCVNEGTMVLPWYHVHGKWLGGFTETDTHCVITYPGGTTVTQDSRTDVPARRP